MQTMQMINVVIDSVRKPEEEGILLVILKEADRERYLPVQVSKDYGEFLVACLEKGEQSQNAPLHMYAFVDQLLDYSHLKVDSAVISATKDDHYVAHIVVTAPSRFYNRQKTIDCHASDALIVATRANVPILITESLMAEKGLTSAEN